MKVYLNIFKFSAIGIALLNIIMAFVSFGGKSFYNVGYNLYSGLYMKKMAGHKAYLAENSPAGTIFLVLSILLLILSVVIIILKFAAKKNIKVLNIIQCSIAVLVGILAIVAVYMGIDYIVSGLDGKTYAGSFDYAETFFKGTGEIILYAVASLGGLLIGAAGVALVFEILRKKSY